MVQSIECGGSGHGSATTKVRGCNTRKGWVESRQAVIDRGAARVILPNSSDSSLGRIAEHAVIVEQGISRPSAGPSYPPSSTFTECHCQPAVRKIASRINEAELTLRERKRRKCQYSYRKLGDIVLTSVFDAFGNWRVHRKCLSKVLPVSVGWLSAKHLEAVERANAPTLSMTKLQICSCTKKRIDSLIENIILPPECTVTTRAFYAAQDMNFKFKISKPKSQHGLVGQASNRARTKERELFRTFVEMNRQPTGRTISDMKRSHGPVFFMNAVFRTIRMRVDDPDQKSNSVAETFNESLRKTWIDANSVAQEKEFNTVAGSTVETWFKEDFGPRKLVNGILAPSDEYTSIYPHKTDACYTCEILNKDMRSLQQRKKRHEQQDDQGSLLRQEALKEVVSEVQEVEEL